MRSRIDLVKEVPEEKSLGQLFGDLASETGELIRHEMRLAKLEMTEKAKLAGKDVGMMAAGGALAYAGLLAVLAGVVLLLGYVMPLWLSALVVGIVAAGIGYALFRAGMNAVGRLDPVPHQTVHTLKEDKRWLQEQMR